MTQCSEDEFIKQLLEYKKHGSDVRYWSESQSYIRGYTRPLYWLISVCVVAYLGHYLKLDELFNSSTDECLINNIEPIQDAFRPPVTQCDFCKIDHIPKLKGISELEFYKDYAYSGIPLLVEDGMRDWDTRNFTYHYFKQLYADINLESQEKGGCQFLGYDSGLTDLQGLFNMSEDRATHQPGTKPWYIGWSNCVPSVSSELREHYKTPYFMGSTERTRHDWIFMGSPSYTGAPLHIDAVDYASWQAQIRGTKKWRFEPPSECWFECPHRHDIEVTPGSIFVFNSNLWYHETSILPGQDSLTIGAEYD